MGMIITNNAHLMGWEHPKVLKGEQVYVYKLWNYLLLMLPKACFRLIDMELKAVYWNTSTYQCHATEGKQCTLCSALVYFISTFWYKTSQLHQFWLQNYVSAAFGIWIFFLLYSCNRLNLLHRWHVECLVKNTI